MGNVETISEAIKAGDVPRAAALLQVEPGLARAVDSEGVWKIR